MAEEKKRPTASGKKNVGAEDKKAAAAVTESVKELSLEEKLAAAVGDISRHDADEKQRRAEQAKSEKRKEEERQARLEEEERIRLERERMSQLLKEQKLAAFEYAENYRKKLKRDSDKAKSASKLRAEEEKAAKLAAEREAKAREIEEQVERERAEAKARAERAERILRAVTMCEVVDENGNVTLVDRAELIAKQKAEAASAAEAPKEAVAQEAVEAPEEAVAQEAVEAPKEVVAQEEAVQASPEAEAEAPLAAEEQEQNEAADEADGDDGIITVSPDSEFLLTVYADGNSPEDEEAVYKKAVEDYNEAARKYNEELAKRAEEKRKADAPTPAKSAAPEKKAAPASPVAPAIIPDADEDEKAEGREEPKAESKPITAKRVIREPWRSEEIPPAGLEDDVVISILKEGKEVDSDKLLKKYLKRSDRAVKDFYKQIGKIERAVDKAHDKNAAPSAVIEVIRILGKIVEIRCDNVSVCAIMSSEKRIALYASFLAEEIEEYNSRVAAYAVLTGEQLTRVSAFLPEHLSAGTGKAVVPVLSYREQYIELKVDENGEVADENGNVTTNLVLPPFTAEEYLGALSPDTKGECKRLAKDARAALKRYDKAIAENEKEIKNNGAKQAKSLEREACATEARETAIRSLNARMPRSNRKPARYAKRLARINSKYEGLILKERHLRAEAEYERKSLRLTVENFVIEREKVHTLAAVLLAVREVAAERDVADTKAALVSEMMEYNRSGAACGAAIGITLPVLSGALADDIARNGRKYPLSKMACRKELIETVGETSRIIGDRLKKSDPDVDVRPDNSDIFSRDKTIEDLALTREQVMIKTLEELSRQVEDRRSYKRFRRKAKRTVKKLRATVKQTNKAIFRAVDEKGVYAGLLENMRVRGKLIEAGGICLSTAVRMHSRRYINKSQDALYDDVRLYNERGIDFETLTGEKFTRISSFLPETMAKGESEHDIPVLNYRETYIEAFPITPETKSGYVDPVSRRAGEYAPLDCRNIRLTDNSIVEVTVIEPPVTTEGNIEYRAATDRRSARETRMDTFRVLFGLSIALNRVKRRQRRNNRIAKRFDKKLAKLNLRFERKLFKLESSVPESRRCTDGYRKKSTKLNRKYEAALLKLRYKRAARSIARLELKLAVEEFVIHRERLEASCARLYSLRGYGRPGYVNSAKADLLAEIRDYNDRADRFARIIGTPITHVSANIVEEIVRNGRIYELPKIICCREIIEQIDETARAIGDKYRFGVPVTVNAQGVAVMTGTSYRLDNFGSPDIVIDKDGGPILGAVGGNLLRYVGKPDKDAPPSKGITYVRNAKEEEKEEQTSSMQTPLLAELDGVNSFLVSAVLARSRVVGTAKELRMYLYRAKKAIKNVRRMVAENRKLSLHAMSDLRNAERGVAGLTGNVGISESIERLRALAAEVAEGKTALEPLDNKRRMLAATVRATEELEELLATAEQSLSAEALSALNSDREEARAAEIAYAEARGRIMASVDEYAAILKSLTESDKSSSHRFVLERYVRRERLLPLAERMRDHYEVSARRLKPKRFLVSLGVRKPTETELLAVTALDARVRRDLLYSGLEEALLMADARIAVREKEIAALELAAKNAKGRERKRITKLASALERGLYNIRVQKNDIEACLAYPTGGFNRQLNRVNGTIYSAVERLEKLEKKQRAKQARSRSRILSALAEARDLRILAAVHELRAVAAHAKLVEIRSMNLYAASKIEISRGSRFKCWLRGFGANPKKKAYEALYSDIDHYNDCVTAASDILGDELSTVSVLTPDNISERSPFDRIPELVYREKFAEVSHRKVANAYAGVYRTPVVGADGTAATYDGVSVTVPVKIPELERMPIGKDIETRGDLGSYLKSYRRALREIERGLSVLASESARIKNEIDDIREDKVHAYDRYQRAVLRITRRTTETVKYQRKMRRLLNRYRKNVYKLECREANSRILRRLRDGSDSHLTAGGLIIGLDGWVRRIAVQSLVYERQRLILTCRNLDRMLRANAKLGKYAVSDAKRQVAEAMAAYNKCRDSCASLIREPGLFRADNRLLDLVVRGRLDEAIALVPRIACSKQLVECTENGEEAISLSTLDPFYKSKHRSVREVAAFDKARNKG